MRPDSTFPDQVGYSGSRYGMTPHQKSELKVFLSLRVKKYGVGVFHHGLCIGGDQEAHEIALELGYRIYGHPPIDQKLMYEFDTSEFVHLDRPFSFSGRNQRIVLNSKILFAAPRVGSVGTYNAIRHAENYSLPHAIVYENKPIVWINEGDNTL